jgi:type II secretory pathway pseudopilin PulG
MVIAGHYVSKQFLQGFTLIEALVLLFVFSVVSIAFFQSYTVGTHLIIESKNRLGATALANQKMEIIRSVDYDTIGTKHWNGSSWVYGIPAGDLLEDETINVNTTAYHVHTFVQYVDDAFDGTVSGSPLDAIPNDYKRVRLTISWGSGGDDQSVSLFASVSPDGIETSAGGGVLVVNVLNSSGAGVSGVSVHISNASASVDFTAQTDSTGNLTLPGTPTSVPAGTQNYIIEVSKNNYYGAITQPPYPSSTYDPVDEHVSVVAGVLNPITIVMDQSSDITLRTIDPFGTNIPNINFSITGGRILGISPTPNPGTIVYSLVQSTSTNGSGEKTFTNQSYGQYTFKETNARYDFYKLDPAGVPMDTTTVVAGVDKSIDFLLLDTQIGSMKVIVTNQSDDSPIAGAEVHVTNAGLSYDVTQTTDQYGFAYFPDALPALSTGTYAIEVSAVGFANNTDTVSVNGSLQTKDISLSPN